jgi:hypothetical protein
MHDLRASLPVKPEKYDLFMKWLASQEEGRQSPPPGMIPIEDFAQSSRDDFLDALSSDDEFMESLSVTDEPLKAVVTAEPEPEKIVDTVLPTVEVVQTTEEENMPIVDQLEEEASDKQVIQVNFTLTNSALQINTSTANLSVSTHSPNVSEKGSNTDLSTTVENSKKPVHHTKGKAPPVPVVASSSIPTPPSMPPPVSVKSDLGNVKKEKKHKTLLGSISGIFKHDSDSTKEKSDDKFRETEI